MDRFQVVDEVLGGAKVLKIKSMQDARGSFQRLFCMQEFREFGLQGEIVNINHSVTKKRGSIRGMHFQYAPFTETKIIKCIRGAIWDVIVDVRKDSPTYLHSYGVMLHEHNDIMFYIPEGFAHGFQALEENTEIIYFVTSCYAQEHERSLNPFDPQLEIAWPLECTDISEKDKDAPLLDTDFVGL